ncbi:MAG: hypothetical protein KJO11_00900 [Gemmatimonadetes bacterium]|nr:hypothetical protein [Gemmatimonadota bacterium]MBT8404601.1 hypothetical protein [Gemmatimonadota bacterium]NNK63249.1 hypothetical protein [Gemmatimonadota bacterium]
MPFAPSRFALVLALLWGVGFTVPAAAQGPENIYLQAVAEHYRVSADEIRVLYGWGRPASELPVVLHLAARGGISPDAVMALRNAGRSWMQIAARWQLHAGDFHVALDPSDDPGALARAYEGFQGSPRTGWPALELRDDEVVALVHLRFFTEYLGVPPRRVLAALSSAGPGPAALQALRRGP